MEKNDLIELMITSLKEVILEGDEQGEIPIDSFNAETPLLGKGAVLDSLGLVILLALIEHKLDNAYGFSLTIADERAMLQERSPFRTVTTLTEYVQQLIEEQKQHA